MNLCELVFIKTDVCASVEPLTAFMILLSQATQDSRTYRAMASCAAVCDRNTASLHAFKATKDKCSVQYLNLFELQYKCN